MFFPAGVAQTTSNKVWKYKKCNILHFVFCVFCLCLFLLFVLRSLVMITSFCSFLQFHDRVNLMRVGELNFPTYILHSNEFLSVLWFAVVHFSTGSVGESLAISLSFTILLLHVELLLVFLFLSLSGTLSSFPKRDYLLQIPAEFLYSPQDCLEPHNNQSRIILSSQTPERYRENMERWI